LSDMMNIVDIDGSGNIDFAEFCALMQSRTEATDFDEELAAVFRSIDTDRDGVISLSDLREIAKQMQWGNDRPPTDDDLAEMLSFAKDAVDLAVFREVILQTRAM